MLHNFLAGKFKSERKEGPACFYDSNKQSYITGLILNCFYSFQKGRKNLAQLVRPYTRESLLRRRISTVDLLVLTISVQLLLSLKKYFSSLQNKLSLWRGHLSWPLPLSKDSLHEQPSPISSHPFFLGCVYRGCIFICLRPFYEQAVSDQDP